MNKEMEYSDIVPDYDNIITKWICSMLGENTNWIQNYQTFGIIRNSKIIAGLIFHNLNYGQDVWWTIYSNDKHWCTRKIIKRFMYEAFEVLQCRRINLLVNTDNQQCLKFVTRLGFKIEGCLRQYREDGKDCYILGLLKSENKFTYKGEKICQKL